VKISNRSAMELVNMLPTTMSSAYGIMATAHHLAAATAPPTSFTTKSVTGLAIMTPATMTMTPAHPRAALAHLISYLMMSVTCIAILKNVDMIMHA
jgi:hypothetical protein